MITKFIKKLFAGSRAEPAAPPPQPARQESPPQRPRRYTRQEHHIELARVSRNAQRVCEGLHNAGFEAWVVGGAVRDLLLGLTPKDFDIATSATPEQVLPLFRRSRIIGRRFKIVHVMFGADTIEVSTYRAPQATDAETDEHGRVLRDNTYGTLAEDAERRDFTINALYYDPRTEVVLDFHDGMPDLQRKVLRIIGEPELRYREDPVRMLRVSRFAAKLDFTIDPKTVGPVRELAPLLENVPAARLFDEMLKLLLSGHAMACLRQLRAEGLHHGVLPLLDVVLDQPVGERFVELALDRTDERIHAGKPVSPSFLFAALLWHQVLERWERLRAAGEPAVPALFQAMDSVLEDQTVKLAIQRRFAADMREIWALQPRFERRTGRAPFRLLEQPRFRAAFDFLLLRCDAGELDAELGKWWASFIDGDEPARLSLIDGLGTGSGTAGTTGKRRRRRRKAGGSGAGASADNAPEDDAMLKDAAPAGQ